MIADGEKLTYGRPVIEGAKVLATAKENGKGDKVIIGKFKSKVHYRRQNGHRQLFTKLSIDKILPTGVAAVKPARKPRAPKKEVTTDGA
jgi:ribosomal protein L21